VCFSSLLVTAKGVYGVALNRCRLSNGDIKEMAAESSGDSNGLGVTSLIGNRPSADTKEASRSIVRKATI
jgi:hypothetical protein